LVLAATGASAAESKRFDGVELKIGTWGGKWKQAQVDMIAAKFEKLGGTITYVTGSPQSNLAKLIVSRGRPPFDMMEFSTHRSRISVTAVCCRKSISIRSRTRCTSSRASIRKTSSALGTRKR
jgi:spermidine/putrescine-binding protein